MANRTCALCGERHTPTGETFGGMPIVICEAVDPRVIGTFVDHQRAPDKADCQTLSDLGRPGNHH